MSVMIIHAIVGKTYAITPQAACSVTTSDGKTIATCPPGEQTIIIAPTTQIEISDPAALVTETFKGAPIGSSAKGGAIATDLSEHKQDAVLHIASSERTTWNNKADASALSSKVNTSTFNAHTGNAVAHTTAEDKVKLGYIALDSGSVAIGAYPGITPHGNGIAIGTQARCGESSSFGIGIGVSALSYSRSVALGYNTRCTATDSLTLGQRARSEADYSYDSVACNTVVGAEARTFSSSNCSVIGALAYCNRHFSVALGYKATSYGEHSVVIGAEWSSGKPHTSILSASDGVLGFGFIAVEKRPGETPRFIFGHYDKLTSTTNQAVAISMDALYTLLKANGGEDYTI